MSFGTTVTLALIALMAPIGAGTIITRRPTLKWTEMLLIAGTCIVPLLVVLSVQRLISPLATVIIVGLVIGHLLTHLDTD
ncbi:hypothetical protein [Haloarchaeobius baliensis]|uniref:hypothetical protein n=1 Tax=Haloarchaeobius baliensis TaxID=1670458 RepID=UPI003F8836F4